MQHKYGSESDRMLKYSIYKGFNKRKKNRFNIFKIL